MAEKRPYFSLSTDEIEKLFNEARNDLKTLELVLKELTFRKRPRAKKLRETIIQHIALVFGKTPGIPEPEQALLPLGPPKSSQPEKSGKKAASEPAARRSAKKPAQSGKESRSAPETAKAPEKRAKRKPEPEKQDARKPLKINLEKIPRPEAESRPFRINLEKEPAQEKAPLAPQTSAKKGLLESLRRFFQR